MTDLVDFDKYPLGEQSYGGAAGVKESILIDDEHWLVKYPDNLRNKNLKNVEISYGSNPISEYIGSKVFEIAGIPVHQVLLGQMRGKMVVACKDFTGADKRLHEFKNYMLSFMAEYIDTIVSSTAGTNMELEDILVCMRNNRVLKNVVGIEQRFWDTFVIDALNGNPDRNTGNWGFLVGWNKRGTELAPVYDNGNCLYFRLSDEQIEDILRDKKELKTRAIGNVPSRFKINGHTISHYRFLRENKDNSYIKLAIQRVIENVSISKIENVLRQALPDGDIKFTFYRELYSLRLEELKAIASM